MTETEMEVVHPLIDISGPGWVATLSGAPVLSLSVAMSDLLYRAGCAGVAPIVVSGPSSSMTVALASALSDLDGHWVIRTPRGTFYDARTGTELADPSAVLRLPPAADRKLAAEFLPESVNTRMQLMLTFSTRHRTSRAIQLGGVAGDITTLVTGNPPAAWGPTEPVVAPWDRAELTEHSRRRIPNDSRWALVSTAATPMVGGVQVARTSEGIEETTRLHFDQGLPGDPRQEQLTQTALKALSVGASHGVALIGVAFARIGAPDLTRRPSLELPIEPLALLIGPPGVRELGRPGSWWVNKFGATLIGSPRIPGVLVELGSTQGGGWERLSELVSQLGRNQLMPLLGLEPALASGQWEGGANG